MRTSQRNELRIINKLLQIEDCTSKFKITQFFIANKLHFHMSMRTMNRIIKKYIEKHLILASLESGYKKGVSYLIWSVDRKALRKYKDKLDHQNDKRRT